MVRLLVDQLKKMPTGRLLNHYRKERRGRYLGRCGCGCEEYLWDIYPDAYQAEKIAHNEIVEYLDTIKSILNKREHVNKDGKNKNKR